MDRAFDVTKYKEKNKKSSFFMIINNPSGKVSNIIYGTVFGGQVRFIVTLCNEPPSNTLEGVFLKRVS